MPDITSNRSNTLLDCIYNIRKKNESMIRKAAFTSCIYANGVFARFKSETVAVLFFVSIARIIIAMIEASEIISETVDNAPLLK